MPTQATGRSKGADFYGYAEGYRLLEDADGWRLVGNKNRLLGKIEGYSSASFTKHTDKGELSGTLFHLRRLYLEHTPAMLLIQGILIQHLIGPNYLFCSGGRSPVYAPRVYLSEVRLAAIAKAPKEMTLPEAVHTLRP
jgi:hypothetical protein